MLKSREEHWMESSYVHSLKVALHWWCIHCKGKYSYHMGESGVVTRWSNYEKQLDVMCFLPWKECNIISCCIALRGWKAWNSSRGLSDKPKLWEILLKKQNKTPELFQNVSAVKDKKIWLRNCLRRKDTKETWQLNALRDAGLDPIQGDKTL